MIYCNDNELVIRNLEDTDKGNLLKWLTDPKVLEYYEGRDSVFDMKKIESKFYKKGDTKRCIIQYSGKAIGYLQFYNIDEDECIEYGYDNPSLNIYGMDQFIGETEYWGKGIGTRFVKAMLSFLVTNKKADKVVLDPHVSNPRAIRCYEKCGFKKVKLLLRHELHEGKEENCYLMEYNAK